MVSERYFFRLFFCFLFFFPYSFSFLFFLTSAMAENEIPASINSTSSTQRIFYAPTSAPTPHPNLQNVIPSIVEQYVNPYHLHHSDNTNLVLVSYLLTKCNYNSWSRATLIGFLCKNKVGFVDGSLPCPTEDSRSS